MRCVQATIGFFALCLIAGAAMSAPYVPTDGAQVIERLPSRNDPTQQTLQQLRKQLNATPGNLQLATTLAQRYIEQGRSAGDPRYFGYAQAALSPWWTQADPPNAVRILRATLRQSQHQFPQALEDLDAVLATDPNNVQAWLTRATILQVQGDYARSQDNCAKLRGMTTELVVATCTVAAASLNGQARPSYTLLADTLEKSANAPAGIKVWALTLLAEIAHRIGDQAAAQAHFKGALALDAADQYLLGAYADFLLDGGKSSGVLELLKNNLRPDGLLLRYALALKQQGSAATEEINTLNARFTAAKLRGDEAHEREQARFELHLLNKPQVAVHTAQENWQVQKEPADARILLEAAIAAKDKAAAEPVLRWLQEKNLEDRKLERLAAEAGALQ